MTCPDPQGKVTLPDGVEVPMGKAIDSSSGQSSLLYNEYPLCSLRNKRCLKCNLFLTKYSSN